MRAAGVSPTLALEQMPQLLLEQPSAERNLSATAPIAVPPADAEKNGILDLFKATSKVTGRPQRQAGTSTYIELVKISGIPALRTGL
jgi:hypothetical protein